MDAILISEIIDKYKSNELTYDTAVLLLNTVGLNGAEILSLVGTNIIKNQNEENIIEM